MKIIKNPKPATYYTKTDISGGMIYTYLYKVIENEDDERIAGSAFGSTFGAPAHRTFIRAKKWCDEVKSNIKKYTEHEVQ